MVETKQLLLSPISPNLRSRSLTSINANPNRLRPGHAYKLVISSESLEIPIPQILSTGLASTSILSPLESRKSFSALCLIEFVDISQFNNIVLFRVPDCIVITRDLVVPVLFASPGFSQMNDLLKYFSIMEQ